MSKVGVCVLNGDSPRMFGTMMTTTDTVVQVGPEGVTLLRGGYFPMQMGNGGLDVGDIVAVAPRLLPGRTNQCEEEAEIERWHQERTKPLVTVIEAEPLEWYSQMVRSYFGPFTWKDRIITGALVVFAAAPASFLLWWLSEKVISWLT